MITGRLSSEAQLYEQFHITNRYYGGGPRYNNKECDEYKEEEVEEVSIQ